MMDYLVQRVKFAARRAGAILCLPALFYLLSAANAAAKPAVLFQAVCRDDSGAPCVFALQGQRLNPTSVLMRFVRATPSRPEGRVLAHNIISNGQLDEIIFNRGFRIGNGSDIHQITFTTPSLAEVYIQNGKKISHYQYCSLTASAPPPRLSPRLRRRSGETAPAEALTGSDSAAGAAAQHKKSVRICISSAAGGKSAGTYCTIYKEPENYPAAPQRPD